MALSRPGSIRIPRAAIAMLLLVGFFASSFEEVWGLVRDGSVHHETTVEALAHASRDFGEHGHESASEALDEGHGPDHRHGTTGDHCTHVHGAAVAAPTAVAILEVEVATRETAFLATHSDHRIPPPFHPPRS